MPRPSIDYLNARRAHKPANGGTNYAVRDRMHSAETERVWAEQAAEYVPSLEDKVAAVFDEFRDWCRNRTPLALMLELGADEIPF